MKGVVGFGRLSFLFLVVSEAITDGKMLSAGSCFSLLVCLNTLPFLFSFANLFLCLRQSFSLAGALLCVAACCMLPG